MGSPVYAAIPKTMLQRLERLIFAEIPSKFKKMYGDVTFVTIQEDQKKIGT